MKMEPIKLISYDYVTIKKVLDIIASMKPSDINEARKQVAAFDTLNNSFVDITDAMPENSDASEEPNEIDTYKEISKEEEEPHPENFKDREQAMLDDVEE